MKRLGMVGILAAAMLVAGYAFGQMGPGMMGGQQRQGGGSRPGQGMMGPGQPHGQTQQQGQQPGSGMMGPGMMGTSPAERPWITIMLDHKDELGLSAEQIGKLYSLRADFAKEVEKRGAEIQAGEQQLSELLSKEPVDLSAVEAKVRQIGSMQSALRVDRIKTIEQGRALLTPEQRKKLSTLAPAPAMGPGRMGPGQQGWRGMEEMQKSMASDRAPQAMAAMMEMARRMGDGDPMLGMARMMEMMGQMESMGGMMGPSGPRTP